ncbi:serine hydrolase domain-containing protein [Haliscomenobacter hydrossis]|uniref:Beta-lactamase n=1 Tax=Haliscomenobacter hydrossis (strain ATCC 27775 / DSM 1100 / LMG 10767 / O) TaxID=760192 RepID=F4KUW4_HALH1|nr:serine hydrolase domain-containing protein [Haliscomenobacter hydrossis]AEE48140.1 beta-lactamase [Haliscomenobacter hydrossis DSM 1100]
MKNLLFALFTLLCISARAQNPAFQKIDQLLTGLAKDHQFSGSVLVAWKGEVFKKGYGTSNREAQTAFTPQTISCIGSVTKQFTGAAILKLEMMGKLNVQDPITKYFEQVPADKQGITLHHLLTHSAGFPGAIGDDYASIDGKTFAQQAFAKPLLFEPGKQYEYSNVGFSLLGIVIEKITGESYEVFLNKQLFKPAGMAQTGYVLPKWETNSVATGYRGERNWGKINEKNWATDGPYWHLRANGGILSNVEDLYKWHQALLGDKILSKAAKTKYYAKHIEEGEGAGSYYGYGWAIFPTPRQTTLIAHNGGNGVFFCDFLRYVDEDITVILLTNAARREWGRLATVCARTCFDPTFVPELKISDVSNAMSPDQAPHQELIDNFLNAISSGDEAKIKAMIEANFAPGFKEDFPLEEHLKILKKVGGDLKGHELATVNVSDESITLNFTGSPLKINVEVVGGKIAGIGVDN